MIMRLISLCLIVALLSGCSTFKPTELDYRSLELSNKAKPMRYAVYTPPNWQPSERLPLVIFLHGGGGSHESFERYGGHRVLDRLIQEGKSKRAIIVLPNGNNGFWENWADGSRHYRDWVINHIMPTVQRDYQTLNCPEHCHIAGISMGGFGSLRMAHYHPDLFSSVSAISAPIFTKPDERPSLLLRLLIPFKRIFGDLEDTKIRTENPYYSWVDQRLDKKMRLQLVWGNADHKGIIEANQNFQRRLNENQIEHDSLVYSGGHKWKYWVTIIEDVMTFTLGKP